MNTVLEIKGLVKRYGSFHLDQFDMVCREGTIMGLVGPNGAGKTTLINAVLDLIRPDAGEILLFGVPLRKQTPEDKEKIGVVFDGNCLPEELSARELNKVFGKLYGNWNSDRYYDYIVRMNIPGGKRVKELSKGNKIKMNLAVAMAHNPQLLILDELTGALDPIVRDDIMELFLEFIQEEKRSILFSTHITTDLEKIADYITFIKDGKLVFAKEKDDLLYGYTILRCKKQAFQKMNPDGMVAYRETAASVDVIWNQRKFGLPSCNGIIAEKAAIEEIMLIMTRGVLKS